MPLAFHVFSVMLFFVGGLMTLLEGASIAHMAGEVQNAFTNARAAAPQNVNKISRGAAPCTECRTHRRAVLHAAVRPSVKPANTIEAAHQVIAPLPKDNALGFYQLRGAQWNYAMPGVAPAPASFDPETGYLQRLQSSIAVQIKSDGYIGSDMHQAQPAVFSSYAQDGFRIYGAENQNAGTCWTENYDPAGRAWSPEACRPSVLQTEEVVEPFEPAGSPYKIGFTTKIRHSVVGLRISRRLN